MREKWTLIMILGFLVITLVSATLGVLFDSDSLVGGLTLILGLYWVLYCDGKGDIFGV